ncbi:MAG: LysM peptidoglycan-binding domain-containing protein [Caldilineaceae bacterium]|nr:LysM peptidoglycan-binding domain-containing protein [Caldilineaceae bacterium]
MRYLLSDRPTAINPRCRQSFITFLVLCLLVLGPLSSTPVFAQDGATVHIVAPGEYLSSIARRYNVSVSVLMAYNNIRNANLIRPGQQILIPSVAGPLPTDTPTPPPNTAVQTTPSTDGASTTPPGIPAATPTRTPPPVASPLDGYTTRGEPVYTVRRGDTLYGLSMRFGVPSSSIMGRNNLRSSVIIVGQRLIIPTGSTQDEPAYRPQVPTSTGAIQIVLPTATSEAVAPGIFFLPTAAATQVSGTRLR